MRQLRKEAALIPTWALPYYEVTVFFLMAVLTLGVLGQGVLTGPRGKTPKRIHPHPGSKAVLWIIVLAIGAGLLLYVLL